jgi:ubiquinone/menaquinone biosynthesis C-methylase UbiE
VTFDWLGDLRGKQLLELGCGAGDYTMMLARRGAQVTAVDIAPASLAITYQRAQANQLGHAVRVSRMAAEALSFPDHSFDWVVGFGLLHHADPVALGPELQRVLRPGGRVLFREPLGTNPLLHLAREYLPYRAKQRSLNEHPLNDEVIEQVGSYFRKTRRRAFYLFSMISRAVGNEMSFSMLWKLDEFLIDRIPFVQRWCRYVLVEYTL